MDGVYATKRCWKVMRLFAAINFFIFLLIGFLFVRPNTFVERWYLIFGCIFMELFIIIGPVIYENMFMKASQPKEELEELVELKQKVDKDVESLMTKGYIEHEY